MATITAAPTISVAPPFNTTPSYSGTFIPTLWSAKLNAKFYTATVFAEIANTNWEGEISGMGDKVVINNIPDLAISTYTPGAGLQYQAPTPNTIELQIDKGKYFAFHVNDLLAMQSQPKLLDMFSNDASMQMKIAIDSNVIYNTFTQGASANKSATAGAKSGSYNLGTDSSPFQLGASGSSAISLITALSAVLDEQNIPETDRFLLLSPADRQVLMGSNLQQAYLTGDSQSILRNGKIGMIDRFTVYISNNLSTVTDLGSDGEAGGSGGAADSQAWNIMAGTRDAITFASQITNVETLRAQTTFGNIMRGLNVYGYRVAKPEALVSGYVRK
jgi:hypothetical protein